MNRFRCYAILVFFFMFFSHVQPLFSHEFLYPVAYTKQDGHTGVYVLYQKSITHLELWLWNPETKIATKGLLSTYTPAGLRILPLNDGFSFIDEGRIRIKKLIKRSPRTIDIYESIYDINEIEWINEDNFYFSAKKNDTFCIFQMDINGVLECLIGDAKYDCMYPQVVDDHLFYIERHIEDELLKRKHLSYKVFRTRYTHPHCSETHITQRYNASKEITKDLLDKDALLDAHDLPCDNSSNIKKECIVDFKEKPISFLKMISEDEGFFIAHPSQVERQDKVLQFDCYHIKKNNNDAWDCKTIFSFSLPAHLLFDVLDARLYESILPLLPRYHEGSIYFVDYQSTRTGGCNIFRYDLALGIIEQKSFSRYEQLSFSPIFIDKKMFYGGIINEQCRYSPKMWISEDGFVCIDLPCSCVN